MEHVKAHHDKFLDLHGDEVVMTSLIGSQNYGLDTETSDYDTFSLVLPSFEDLALANDPVAGEYDVEDGKCMYKDIRIALNLLKKPSPNSLEVFFSNYVYINPQYKEIIDNYINYPPHAQYIMHCSYQHMIDACVGMSKQLATRNMPSGKKLSHAIRMKNMLPYYLDNLYAKDLLKIHDEDDLLLAQEVKPITDKNFDMLCAKIANYLSKVGKNFKITEWYKEIEKLGMSYIEQFQFDIFSRYLESGAI
jgi:predicted nucleotidyltransferase